MPHLEIEKEIMSHHNVRTVAGLDEAGRGALAGPVVAAAVLFACHDPDLPHTLAEVNDSKQLSAKTRERLFDLITGCAIAYGVGVTPPSVIDESGILPATRLAMTTAVADLTPEPDFLLIDGRIRLPHLPHPQQSLIRGDSISLSIAAASILAKVTRDRLMVELDDVYPQYGFARHKGYGTAFHRAALAEHGPTPHHRFSFAPLRQMLI